MPIFAPGVLLYYYRYTLAFTEVNPAAVGIRAFPGVYVNGLEVANDGDYLVVFNANYHGTKIDAAVVTVENHSATLIAFVRYVPRFKWSDHLIAELKKSLLVKAG